MADALKIVQEFCDLMVKRDAEPLRNFFAPDAVYHNTGMVPTVGVDAIIENLIGQFGMFPDSYEYVVKNIVASGDVVMTERLDMIGTPNGIQGVPVMGTFVLTNGKIARWTDYFDTALPMKMMTGEDVSTLVPLSY